MRSNRDRLKYLKEKLGRLSTELHSEGLEPNYRQLLETITHNQAVFTPISDAEWDVMLPEEQQQKLLQYYHTVRTEFLALTQKAEESGLAGKLREWLESPYIQTAIAGIALAEIAVKLLELAHSSGLFYREDEGADYLS